MIPHVPEPITGDIVQLILDDHRLFEALLRELRLDVANREVLRACFADVVLAHGEAEEQHVYTSLQRRRTITAHEAEHGEEEHAELNAAILALWECKGLDTQKFDDAVEEVTKAMSHHIAEEEQSILRDADQDLGVEARADLGKVFCAARSKGLADHIGAEASLRRIVARAEREGLLPPEGESEEE